jgi:hypothetical protein
MGSMLAIKGDSTVYQIEAPEWGKAQEDVDCCATVLEFRRSSWTVAVENGQKRKGRVRPWMNAVPSFLVVRLDKLHALFFPLFLA